MKKVFLENYVSGGWYYENFPAQPFYLAQGSRASREYLGEAILSDPLRVSRL